MAKVLAKGTTLAMSSDGGTTWVPVAQLTKVPTPPMKRAAQDTSDHDTVDAHEYTPEKLYDAGEIAFEGHWDPSLTSQGAATGVMKAFTDGTDYDWQVTLPDTAASTFTFTGHVSEAPMSDVDFNSKLTFSFKVRINGAVTQA